MAAKKDKSKLLFGAVIVLLCIFFVGGVIIGANSLLEMEGTLEPADKYLLEGAVIPASDAQEAMELINNAVKTAIEQKPKLDSSDRIKIGDDFLIGKDSSAYANKVVGFIKDSAADEFAGEFTAVSADFGEGFSDSLWIPDIAVEDIVDFDCQYIYYHCMQCAADSDKPYEKCSECGNENGPQMRYRDELYLTVVIDENSSSFKNNFNLRSADSLEGFLTGRFDEYLNITAPFEFGYKNVKICARIDRFSGKLLELKYIKDVDVTTTVSFVSDYSYLGENAVYIPVNEEVCFSFTWPGVSLSSSELSMTQKGTEALKATLTCDNPLNYDVTWTSSDESIATVDEDGYVESLKKDGKVIITASFEFQGVTYSDECEVFVKTSVESIDISKRKLEMRVGETYTQTLSFSPKDSTVQTAKWYSTDENVAKVSEDGVITAVGAGSAQVYAVSDDGYFKATCNVEVTE